MGPRLVSRGNLEPQGATCGRELALQWGRGSSAAETTRMAAPSTSCLLLQWGRGSSAAETSNLRAQPVGGSWRFNGAAARQPRKRGQRRRFRAHPGGLQWGRGSSAAETPAPPTRASPLRSGFNGAAARQPRKPQPDLLDFVQDDAASMGPRLVSRGNSRAEKMYGYYWRLQWGRGSSAAETSRPTRTCAAPSPLQWGRGSSAAETLAERFRTKGESELQWGRGSSAAETTVPVIMETTR